MVTFGILAIVGDNSGLVVQFGAIFNGGDFKLRATNKSTLISKFPCFGAVGDTYLSMLIAISSFLLRMRTAMI